MILKPARSNFTGAITFIKSIVDDNVGRRGRGIAGFAEEAFQMKSLAGTSPPTWMRRRTRPHSEGCRASLNMQRIGRPLTAKLIFINYINSPRSRGGGGMRGRRVAGTTRVFPVDWVTRSTEERPAAAVTSYRRSSRRSACTCP